MDFAFFTPWHRFLPRDVGHVVAFGGGSGKADLAAACARVLVAEGVPVARCGPGDPDPGDGVLVLADADGQAERPLHLPPPASLWPGRASLAVVAMGVDGVGGLVSDVLDPAGADRADLAADAVLTWQHLGDLLLDPAVTGLPLATPTVLALTGLQGQPDSIGLFEFAGRVMTDPRLPILLFCAGTGETPEIRACCRTAGAEDPGTPAAPEV